MTAERVASWTHPVASFWAGGDLSFVEQMVIRSYVEQGCDFTLYVPQPVGGIPAGTTVRDAAAIMPVPAAIAPDPDPDRKALAVWSDLFRVRLLSQRAVIWVDLDAYCLRPYAAPEGHLFGRDDADGVLTGVMALPPESPALALMREMLAGDEVEPPWRDENWIRQRRKKGRLSPFDLPWGDTGPRLLTHALRETGGMRHASPHEVFYPLFRNSLRALWRPGVADDRIARPGALSVHIFGYTKRYLATFHDGLPPDGSWLARRAAAHGIDPARARARGEPLEPRPTAGAPARPHA